MAEKTNGRHKKAVRGPGYRDGCGKAPCAPSAGKIEPNAQDVCCTSRSSDRGAAFTDKKTGGTRRGETGCGREE